VAPDQILSILVGFTVFVFSVVVHENAHGLAAERFGDPTARDAGRITMNPLPHIDPVGSIMLPLFAFISSIPFIGWAKPVPVNSANLRNPIVHNAYVAAAGPISNFLLALAGTLLYIVVLLFYKHVPFLAAGGGQHSLLFFGALCSSMIQINCVLGIFNLIPVPPLDGHWILFRYLPPRYAQMLAAMRPYGFFILIALLWTGAIRIIIWLPWTVMTGFLRNLVNLAVATF
jgi:Zn-dependent protease